jgi:hypothetical protein
MVSGLREKGRLDYVQIHAIHRPHWVPKKFSKVC